MGILTDDMRRMVEEQQLGFIATVCPDGTPNLSPKGTTAVWDDDHLVFADICSPATVENLRHNAAIEINVVDPFVRKGYRFKGPAIVYGPETPAFGQGIERLRQQGFNTPTDRIKAIVVVEVRRAEPLISPAYDDGSRSEPEIAAVWRRHFAKLHPAKD